MMMMMMMMVVVMGRREKVKAELTGAEVTGPGEGAWNSSPSDICTAMSLKKDHVLLALVLQLFLIIEE